MHNDVNKEDKEKNFISAVVYVRNNENNIKEFLNFINNYLNKTFLTYEIICVNDASEDNSVTKIKEFAGLNNENSKVITLLNMSYYQGIEKSMHAGVDLAIGDFVYEFDSTAISYPVNILKEVYSRCLDGYDIVSASPIKSNHKQASLFYALYNNISNSLYKLRTEAFRIISRRGINRVISISKSTIYRKSAYSNCGLAMDTILYDKISEIPHTENKERLMQIETAINALILYTDIAYKFSIIFAFIMLGLTILAGIYTSYMYIVGNSIKGWTTMMLLLSFGFFAVISILTILIKYTSLILKIVFHKQKYIIESIIKLK